MKDWTFPITFFDAVNASSQRRSLYRAHIITAGENDAKLI